MYAIFRHGKQYRVGKITDIFEAPNSNPFEIKLEINKKWVRWGNEIILLRYFDEHQAVDKHTKRINFNDISKYCIRNANIIKLKNDKLFHDTINSINTGINS